MLFVLLTSIGVSMILQQKIRQEFEESSELLDKHRAFAHAKGVLDIENAQLSEEIEGLFEQRRALVIKRDGDVAISNDLYAEAMEELELDLARDPLDIAFDDLERRYAEKKKTGL